MFHTLTFLHRILYLGKTKEKISSSAKEKNIYQMIIINIEKKYLLWLQSTPQWRSLQPHALVILSQTPVTQSVGHAVSKQQKNIMMIFIPFTLSAKLFKLNLNSIQKLAEGLEIAYLLHSLSPNIHFHN